MKSLGLRSWRKGACQRKAAESFQNWTLSGEVWLVWPTVSNEYLFCILSPGVHGIYPAMFGTCYVALMSKVYGVSWVTSVRPITGDGSPSLDQRSLS